MKTIIYVSILAWLVGCTPKSETQQGENQSQTQQQESQSGAETGSAESMSTQESSGTGYTTDSTAGEKADEAAKNNQVSKGSNEESTTNKRTE
jgi:hypothetical protein